ncbi:MAG: hypothetical protein Kow00109_25410 [Acidobacteriota bacterium]
MGLQSAIMEAARAKWTRAVVAGLILAAVVYLFRGWMSQGMEMDEVTRVNNVIPLLHPDAEPNRQAIYEIRLGGWTVPIMYKFYISSAYVIRWFPLAFFDDYLFGIRFLHLFYFALSCTVLFWYLARRDLYLGAAVGLLVATSPFFYPEVRIGFADSLFLAFLVPAAYCAERAWRDPPGRFFLFLGAFFLAFAANQMFYFTWVIAGLTVSAALLRPEPVKVLARSTGNWLAVAAGLGLGMIHHVVYNLTHGFPVLRILLGPLLGRLGFGAIRIDYAELESPDEGLAVKLDTLRVTLSEAWTPYLVLFAVALFAALGLALKRKDRTLLFPAVASLAILAFIFLTPRAFRPGHYVYLSPFLELSLVIPFWLAAREFGRRRFLPSLLRVFPLFLVALNFWTSNAEVVEVNRTGGRGLFSPATLAFNRYLEREGIESHNVVFFVWGLHAQPYFLQKGRFYIKNWVYRLIDLRDEQAQQRVYERFFRSVDSRPVRGDLLYFPFWSEFRSDLRESFVRFVADRGGKLSLVEVFTERNGDPAILFYRLEGVGAFRQAFLEPIAAAPESEALTIADWGPRVVAAWGKEGIGVWLKADGFSRSTRVCLDGEELDTVVYPHHLTAHVPAFVLEPGGRYRLFLYDPEQGIRSRGVLLQARPAEP